MRPIGIAAERLRRPESANDVYVGKPLQSGNLLPHVCGLLLVGWYDFCGHDPAARHMPSLENSAVCSSAKDIIEVQELKLQSGRFLADVQDLVQSALAEFDADSDGAELGWGFSDSDYESDPFDY